MNEIQESYNNLPYISSAFSETSPARLEALASFLSLTPPPSKTAKVLEIGCSYGGNLFPFAIVKQTVKFAKERNLEFTNKNEYQKAAEDYVKDLELKLSDGGFLENF